MLVQLLQVPGEISKVSSMAHRSLRLLFDSQENLNDEEMAKIMAFVGKNGWFTFSPQAIQPNNILNLPKLDLDETKSPSQRLRGTIWILWEQQGKQGEFNDFYKAKMEKLIDFVKAKLA